MFDQDVIPTNDAPIQLLMANIVVSILNILTHSNYQLKDLSMKLMLKILLYPWTLIYKLKKYRDGGDSMGV